MDVWPRRDLKGQRYALSFFKIKYFCCVILTVVFKGRLRRIMTCCIAYFMAVVFLKLNVLEIETSSPFSKLYKIWIRSCIYGGSFRKVVVDKEKCQKFVHPQWISACLCFVFLLSVKGTIETWNIFFFMSLTALLHRPKVLTTARLN